MTRLLVLDDEPEIGRAIGSIADEFSFESELTTTPSEFARSMVERGPDLIALDLTFPGGDGIEMLRFLQTNGYRGALILISGADDRALTTARRLGLALTLDVIGAVRKPFAAQSIRELFAKVAGRDPILVAADFHAAIANSELIVHHQPVVDMKSRAVLGVEALVRWARPGRGLVMPDEFLPHAAREGLMRDLTRTVIDTALADASNWRQQGIDLCVAVNVPASVVLSATFLDEIVEARKRYGEAPPRMMIEVTETEAMGEPIRTMEVLSRLRLLGVGLAIDDFGTGYSSLVELRRLPFNRVKIDKSFVLSCVHETDAAAITKGVIDLSHALGIGVVAEGVETEQIWHRLVEWGCDAAQGYFVNRPMPNADLIGWIGRWSGGAVSLD
jgi:EAL domain-containing protein (putative c-di-GMP-specific phosphodiesterase class I)